MKKTLTLVLVAMILVSGLLILTGCNNNTSSDKNTIVGKWQSKEYSSYVYTFNDDGTGDYSGTKFTYTTEDNNISITYDGSTAAFKSTYEIKDNELIIKDSFGKDTVYTKK